jgi:hypothetical protein
MLSAIRSDPQVYLVQYATNRDSTTKYKASLLYHSEEGRISGTYAVILSPGWSFGKHEAVLGNGLKGKVIWVLAREDVERVMYNCDNVDHGLLGGIREDVYVDLVECGVMTPWPPRDGPKWTVLRFKVGLHLQEKRVDEGWESGGVYSSGGIRDILRLSILSSSHAIHLMRRPCCKNSANWYHPQMPKRRAKISVRMPC